MDDSKFMKELLRRVFDTNHKVLRGHNSNSIYLIGFNKEQFKELEENVKLAVKSLERVYKFVNCANKTFIEIVEEIVSVKYKTNYEAGKVLEQVQMKSNIVIILREFSKSKIKKSDVAMYFKTLIKNLDDAHFENIHPLSDLIFIDYASFLEKNFNEIGLYLVYNLWPNNQTLQEHFTKFMYLKTNSN